MKEQNLPIASTKNYSGSQYFRPVWEKWISLNPVTGFLFLIVFTIARYLLVIRGTESGSFQYLPILFLVMALTPAILLNKKGRRWTGIKKPENYSWLVYSFLAGLAACMLVYGINLLLFQKSLENAIVYISRSYDGTRPLLTDSNKTMYFIIYAIIAMTISPIGEEIFFRGFIHENFAYKWGDNHASDADSIAFAITHLVHFGIVYVSGMWTFYFASAMVWLVSMYVVSRLFFYCRERTGSIYGAVVAHSGFNFAMTYIIFYHI